MAKLSNLNSRVYFDEFNLSGVLNAFDQAIAQETPVVTCFSDSGPRRLVGNYDVSLSDLGYLEPADDDYDEQLFAALNDTDDHYILHLPGANAVGSVSYDFVARVSAQPRSARIGEAILLNFDSQGANGLSRGLVLFNKTTTSGENGTGQNLGATTTGQVFQATIRVLSFSGTNITIAIQESSDDAVGDPYAAITGMTETFTGIGVSRETTTAATEAYKRVVVSGTYTSVVVMVTAGVVRGT